MPAFRTIAEATEKNRLLAYFRALGAAALRDLKPAAKDSDQLAKHLNKMFGQGMTEITKSVVSLAEREGAAAQQRLEALLTCTYTGQVVMLEHRNQARPYEYMDFSRRVGELWEALIRLVFHHAPNKLSFFDPPLFADVRAKLRNEHGDFIASLPLATDQKQRLIAQQDLLWRIVDSGSVNLSLDLHVVSNEEYINIDLKTGIGSQEKGNASRLLLVATIYKLLVANYRNVMLVRADEELNNNYFQRLKSSGVWEVHAGAAAYEWIAQLTGFDIGAWLTAHATWMKDLDPAAAKHLEDAKLDGYLDW